MIRLINKYFWKSSIGFIGVFLYNFLFVTIIALLSKEEGSIGFASLITLPIITIGISFMPVLIIDLKRTTFMQRILLENSKRKNLFLPFLFFIPIILIAYLLCFLIILVINYDQISLVYGNTDWFQLVFSVILTAALSLFIGQMVYSNFKNLILSQSITTIMVFLITLLSGIIIPITVISEVAILKYISYINPFKFTNNLMINSWFANQNPINLDGGGIFNFTTDFKSLAIDVNIKEGIIGTKKILLFTKTEKIFNLLVPFIYILVIFSLNFNKNIALQFTKNGRKIYDINWIKKFK